MDPRTKFNILPLLLALSFSPLYGLEDADDLLSMSLNELLNIEVVTATKIAEKSDNAPATVHVISESTIRTRGYRNLKDVLEDIPEVEIQSNAVAEFNNYYTFRGISGNDRFIVLLNGFRFNSPTGSPHVIENNYPLVNVKRVEVILGPASALYGADAFGGIVNIITKDGDKSQGGSADLGAGRFGTREASLSYSRNFGQVYASVTAYGYESDEPTLPDFYPDEYAWYNNQYRNEGLVLVSPFIPVEQELDAEQQGRPYETPNEAQYINIAVQTGNFSFGYATNTESHSSSTGMRPEFNLFVEDAIFEIEVESMYIKHTHRADNDRWFLDSSLWKGTYELTPASKFLNTFTVYRDGFKYADAQTVKAEQQLTYLFENNSTFIAGLSYEDISALPKSGDLPFAFNPNVPAASQDLFYIGTNTTDQNGNDLTVSQQFFDVSYRNLGAYMQYVFKASEKAHITLGARFDDNTRYGSTFNPRAGLVYSPTDKVKLKLLYGSGFLAPSPYVALQHYGSFITVDEGGNATNDPEETAGLFGPFWHLPNPDLEPEELDTYEASLSWYANDHLGIFLNGYHNTVSNRVVNSAQFGREFQGIPVDFAEVPINAGESTSYGGTLRLNLLYPIGQVNLNAYLAYSLSDGDIDDTPLTYSAEDTVRFGAEISYRDFSVAPRILWRSESRHFLVDDNGSNFENDSYSVTHLFVRYDDLLHRGNTRLGAYLRVQNLFDKRYANVPFAQFEAFTATPQDPRHVGGGISITF
ncbi:TonB-dependent receptor [Sulfidibacter corallicola]|uniref:TonB-dependent receptor n=1 Tax=Sulfidibacter corallicola TaxID=2818388 RepID=A0A8A4TV27_SULCO|nr:TonB-dependent receptor [Sulfidibacter corallicola]QTD52971.1 TonB-dependent receptor [Sulfidibacter corallicola]